MKQKDLKMLAEWNYGKENFNLVLIKEKYKDFLILDFFKDERTFIFEPSRNINQFYELKNKMIKEIIEKYETQIFYLQIYKPDGKCTITIYHTKFSNVKRFLPYYGESVNNEIDANLNIILNYIIYGK